MRIFRFDEELSIPIRQFGSRFRIGPITGDNSRVRVQAMYLPADGVIGRHEAEVSQLLAVASGAGWVSGDDGVRHDLGTGYAAWWDAGESHEAGSDGGLMAISIEGEFEIWAMAVTQHIVVVDYDPAWPGRFEALRRRVWPAVEDLAVRIDHVGSTSVVGLAAKPIIDMDVVVAAPDDVAPAIERLATIGYRWRGDLGVPGREAFDLAGDDLPAHHLYLVVEDNRAHLDHWLLRDLLRSEPEARERYAALKRRNVDVAAGDMDRYVAAKASLVAELLTRARHEHGLPPVTYWEPEL